MVDIEERAFRRDKRFLVRLVLVLTAGIFFGLLIFAKLTNMDTSGCAGTMVGAPPATDAK